MTTPIEAIGGSGDPVLFAHANGYPPGSYRQLFARLQGRCRLHAMKQRPLWRGAEAPGPRADWHLFADDLLAAMATSGIERPWLLGHSLGAVVGVLAAARSPSRFRGLLLLDPVFVPTRTALGLRLLPARRLERLPMVRAARRRPESFADRDAAFDFYRGKRAFAGFDDDALRDYIDASCVPSARGGVELAFPPAWEAAIYASVPLVWHRLPRLQLPTLGLRGAQSRILSPAMFQRWGRLQPRAELHSCPGGHLFPLEEPAAAAQRIIDFLERQ